MAGFAFNQQTMQCDHLVGRSVKRSTRVAGLSSGQSVGHPRWTFSAGHSIIIYLEKNNSKKQVKAKRQGVDVVEFRSCSPITHLFVPLESSTLTDSWCNHFPGFFRRDVVPCIMQAQHQRGLPREMFDSMESVESNKGETNETKIKNFVWQEGRGKKQHNRFSLDLCELTGNRLWIICAAAPNRTDTSIRHIINNQMLVSMSLSSFTISLSNVIAIVSELSFDQIECKITKRDRNEQSNCD